MIRAEREGQKGAGKRVVKIGELSTGRNLKRPRVGAKIWVINTDRDIKSGLKVLNRPFGLSSFRFLFSSLFFFSSRHSYSRWSA